MLVLVNRLRVPVRALEESDVLQNLLKVQQDVVVVVGVVGVGVGVVGTSAHEIVVDVDVDAEIGADTSVVMVDSAVVVHEMGHVEKKNQ